MTQDRYVVSEAIIEEVPGIAEFQVAMALETEGKELDYPTVERGVSSVFRDPQRGFYVTAKDDRKQTVASALIQKEWSDWRCADVWWIHSVYVVPSHRRMGVFKKMFEYIENKARESGIFGIRLFVDKTNEKAKAVYRNLDMTDDHYELFEKMLRRK